MTIFFTLTTPVVREGVSRVARIPTEDSLEFLSLACHGECVVLCEALVVLSINDLHTKSRPHLCDGVQVVVYNVQFYSKFTDELVRFSSEGHNLAGRLGNDDYDEGHVGDVFTVTSVQLGIMNA